jgi:hypothetical protein
MLSKPVNGAWQEVWSNVKLMKLLGESLTNVHVSSPTAWGEKTNIQTMHDNGQIIYTASVSCNNPTISFDYWGYVYYYAKRDGYDRFLPVGSLYAYGIKSDGKSEQVLLHENINTYGIASNEMLSKSYTFTNGDYQQIGFKVQFINQEEYLTADNATDIIYHFAIKNFKIDNQKYITDVADDFSQGTV